METGAILGRAWVITRRYSWLWIIGLFLTGMASGNVDLTLPGGSNVTGGAAEALSVPAVIAGCATRIVCTPPRPDGLADPAVVVAASRAGVTDIFKVGGAQAIAAMAYGTASVPRVGKIFGPGNAWVTCAKSVVSSDPDGAAIDMPAGPSEVLVIADGDNDPDWMAADLLAQAEPDVSVFALGQGEAGIAPAGQFDLVLDAPTVDRGDPCAAFR